jgi:hypothetical protein
MQAIKPVFPCGITETETSIPQNKSLTGEFQKGVSLEMLFTSRKSSNLLVCGTVSSRQVEGVHRIKACV